MAQETTEPMTDNEALNALVVETELIADILANRYDSVSGDTALVAVSNTVPVTRAAAPTAVKVAVTNGGTHVVRVFMSAVLVALVQPGETRELPMDGSAALQIDCAPGESSLIAVATFKKTP